jgi:polyketide synthase PksN
MDAMEIFTSCPALVITYVRSDPVAHKFDLDVCDESGTVCMRISGLSVRATQLSLDCAEAQCSPVQRWVLLCEGLSAGEHGEPLDEACERALIAQGTPVRRLRSGAPGASGAERFKRYALQLFELLEDILKSESQSDVLLQLVVDVQREQDLYASLGATLASSALENPRIRNQVIAVSVDETSDTLLEKLAREYEAGGHVK